MDEFDISNDFEAEQEEEEQLEDDIYEEEDREIQEQL